MYEELNEDMDCEIRDQKDDPYYDRKQELFSDCMLLAGDESTGRKPLNIAIIGPPGCGKSAFLNTVFASFNNDCWFEFAKSGEFGNLEGVMGMQISNRLKRYIKFKVFKIAENCGVLSENEIMVARQCNIIHYITVFISGGYDIKKDYLFNTVRFIFSGGTVLNPVYILV